MNQNGNNSSPIPIDSGSGWRGRITVQIGFSLRRLDNLVGVNAERQTDVLVIVRLLFLLNN